jgi:hypothetical protein
MLNHDEVYWLSGCAILRCIGVRGAYITCKNKAGDITNMKYFFHKTIPLRTDSL